ncbi:Tim44 domain-containing protein [Polynucleobacter paneuropaeus]|nr:Tim44 domain-containing protein [Polynucleobacter paneuropaeus]
MNKHFFKAALLSCTLLFAAVADADAARLGGGRSFGRAPSAPIQRQAIPPQRPVQQAQPAAPAAAPAQPAAPSRFGGIGGMLGGLAAGLGIAYLFSHFGLGEGMASMFSGLLIALLVGFAIMFVIRRLLPSFSGAQGMQRTSEPLAKQEPAFQPVSSAASAVTPSLEKFESTMPPGFEEYSFLENAKQFFVRLQKAWDLGDLVSLKEYTTPEMFITIEQDLAGRFDASNQTEVVSMQASLLGIETADGNYYCSVQFTGMIREQVSAPASNFSEIWNLSKPVNGPGGWVLAGIQQLV